MVNFSSGFATGTNYSEVSSELCSALLQNTKKSVPFVFFCTYVLKNSVVLLWRQHLCDSAFIRCVKTMNCAGFGAGVCVLCFLPQPKFLLLCLLQGFCLHQNVGENYFSNW